MPPASLPGILHRYAPRLVAFEHAPATASNKLLFIGGLGDGLGSVPYVERLNVIPGWSVVEVLISSSYKGWGVGTVMRDAEELAQCVQYFKDLTHPDGKVVLMGHSTGSQDTMQYLLNSSLNKGPKLSGAIFQAAVSDRQALVEITPRTTYLSSLDFAESYIKAGQGNEVVPRDFRPGNQDTPVTAERWYSVAAPLDIAGNPQGAEDFFSSDIGDHTLAQTFGQIPTSTPIMILQGGQDQYVPKRVNMEALVARWTAVAERAGVRVAQGSGIVPGANHNLEGVSEDVTKDLVSRVKGFLEEVADNNRIMQ